MKERVFPSVFKDSSVLKTALIFNIVNHSPEIFMLWIVCYRILQNGLDGLGFLYYEKKQYYEISDNNYRRPFRKSFLKFYHPNKLPTKRPALKYKQLFKKNWHFWCIWNAVSELLDWMGLKGKFYAKKIIFVLFIVFLLPSNLNTAESAI